MPTIKDIQTKNTMLFLSNFTDKTIDLTKDEILKRRTRRYPTRTMTSQINSSGEGLRSLSKKKTDDGYDIIGNDYLEEVDEGTSSTRASLSDIMQWVKRKPVKFINDRGSFTKVTGDKQKALARLIQKSLVFNGIHRTAFLTDLVEASYDRLNGIENSVADDVVDSMESILLDAGLVKKGEKYVLDIKR